MEIKLSNNRTDCTKWQIQQNQAEFLQSFEWGEFQEQTGKAIKRWQLLEEGKIVDQVQGFEHQLGLGMKYLYLPRLKTYDLGIKMIVEYCKKGNYIFLRIENVENVSYALSPMSYVRNRQPQTTLILDLQKNEDELLQEMHAKTRYNIHVAEKHGVEIRQDKNVEVFWQLNLETTQRDNFKSHNKDYYQKMLNLDIIHQITAYYKGKPITSNIFVGFGDTFTYLHGASSGDWRNLMAPYLLQWEGIKLAKNLGFKVYDFWGIAPIVNESDFKPHSCFNNFCWEVNHPWTGVTRFKVGFGGVVKEYPEACDLILKPWGYRIYKLIRKIKGLK